MKNIILIVIIAVIALGAVWFFVIREPVDPDPVVLNDPVDPEPVDPEIVDPIVEEEIKEEIKAVEEIAVLLSPDETSILLQKNEEKVEIYTLAQLQKWGEKENNWDRYVGEVYLWQGKRGPPPRERQIKERVMPKHFRRFEKVVLSPNQEKVAFLLRDEDPRANDAVAIIGILDLDAQEIIAITRTDVGLWLRVREIIWSPNSQYIAYRVKGCLRVFDIINQKRKLDTRKDVDFSTALGWEQVGRPGFAYPGIIVFDIREIQWSLDSERIYFATLLELRILKHYYGEQVYDFPEYLYWVINVDGTGLTLK